MPSLFEMTTVAGDERTSIFQPQFSPDGRWLVYVSDKNGWWQIYVYDLEAGEHRQLTQLLAEHGEPAWVQGVRTYAFSSDGKRLFFLRNQMGSITLWQLEVATGAEQSIPLAGYTSLLQPAVSPDGKRLALLASAGNIPLRVITCDLGGGVHIWRRAMAEELPPDGVYPPPAHHLAWHGWRCGARIVLPTPE